MKIFPVQTKQLNDIVALHMRVLSTTSTQIGKQYVSYLYRKCFDLNGHTILGCYFDSKNCAGFLAATEDFSYTISRLTIPRSKWFVLDLTSALFNRKLSVITLFKRILFERVMQKIVPDATPVILTLGVAPECQGRGIGKSLVKYYINQIKKEGHSHLYVDTELKNIQAIRFYKRLGFTEVYSGFDSVLLCLRNNLGSSVD